MNEESRAGFTLVELLVALVIFAFIMALSFDALRFSGAAWESVSSEAITTDEQGSVLRFLRNRIEGISRPNEPSGQTGESIQWWLDGDSDEVTFVAPWYRGAVPAGLYKFRLWHDVRDGTGRLNLAWEPHLRGVGDDLLRDLSGERALAEGIAALSLRYFGSEDPASPAQWSRSWSDPTVVPRLLEVVITSESTGENWPRLVVDTGH